PRLPRLAVRQPVPDRRRLHADIRRSQPDTHHPSERLPRRRPAKDEGLVDPSFNDIFTSPDNDIFKVVFFPDRIYHARYLNATRSRRYRYNVQEVRGKFDTIVLKGEVYMDGLFLSNFVRIEYRAGRLVEAAREKGRFVRGELLAWLR